MKFGSYLQTNWDWRAAGNFMLGGTGGALMLMTAIGFYPEPPPLIPGLSALAMVGIGLGLVWLEIGRPWRFLNVFFHPKTSWMTREGSVAVLLFALACIGILLKHTIVIAIAGLMGLAFLYCQARILKAAKGIPAWRTASIVPLIISTGLAEGTAMLLLILAIIHADPYWMSYLLLILVSVRLIAWKHYRASLAREQAPQASQKVLSNINPVFMTAGNILPALIILAAILTRGYDPVLNVSACALIVLSGWYLKFIIVVRAAHVQGYALGVPRKKPV